jgi:AraC-like DNA-binding protein
MLNRPQTPAISHWSTDNLAPRDRWASVVQALDEAIVPISVSIDDPRDFEFHMSSMDLDEGISVLHQIGSAHGSSRGKRELARSDAHTYHFLINLGSHWTLQQRGDYRVAAGEGMLVDSNYVHALVLPGEFEIIHVKMHEDWLHRWISPGQPMAGRRFAQQAGFSAALNLFAAQLSPHLLKESPLAAASLAEKFGALMAMAADGWRGDRAGLGDQIRTVMAQRSAEPGLGAADIARDLHISPAELHQALAARSEVFADALTRLRFDAALRMLRSPSFRNIPMEEVSARAGFSGVRAMLRVLPGATALRR